MLHKYKLFIMSQIKEKLRIENSNKKIEAWILPTKSQTKTTCYILGESFLHPFDGKYCSATVFLVVFYVKMNIQFSMKS